MTYSLPGWTPRGPRLRRMRSARTPDEGCPDELNDSIAAYTKALLWYYTGDTRYAAAITIMNAWPSTLIDHRFDATHTDGHLQAAWVGEVFPRAAEIIRHTYTPGPRSTGVGRRGRFSAMLDRAFLPPVIDG